MVMVVTLCGIFAAAIRNNPDGLAALRKGGKR